MVGKTQAIEEYFAGVSEDKRHALEELREAIKAAAPSAEEGFSYGLPAFRLDGRPLVAYGASKNHCSLYPMSPEVIKQNKDDLKAYETSKGTIRFSPEKPLPVSLVRKLVKARIAELQKAKERILRRLTNRWSTLFDYASPLAQAQGRRAAQLLAVRPHCFNHQLAEVNNGISP